MLLRRPGSRRTRGVRALVHTLVLAVALSPLTGCSGPVEITSYDLGVADRAACEAFVADLPASLADEDAVEVSEGGLGAAYGEPAITVTCGVPVPPDYDVTSRCDEVDGVGWYVPSGVDDDRSLDLRVSVPGYRPVVEVLVPSDYRPGDPNVGEDTTAAVLATLSPLVEEHLNLLKPCTG